ncbi:hypothetical protein C4K88_14770 [Arthrobacter pityocampae]|uniref:Uncharacterized protein n=1 Tax=Arthrobacter pityocampae TaxID=547334 RepID=A0A2S5IUJ8_9MICC|nr:hypothetical protein [Arthrobacter pityocampae]PPB48225.1 hypothetical protein C4K88_14770 [Arthrobacter pityocampae]
MENWRSANRAQDRRLWHTLWCVGVALTLTLASSILVAVGGPGGTGDEGFYVQQAVLLALSAAGTVVALRRWRALRG